MTKQAMKSHEDQRDKTQKRPSHGYDLAEVLKKAREEALGTLAPNSF